jgi:hypothetical protein
MCDKAEWLQKLKKVYSLYSCPDQRNADSAQCNIPEIQGLITVVALSI